MGECDALPGVLLPQLCTNINIHDIRKSAHKIPSSSSMIFHDIPYNKSLYFRGVPAVVDFAAMRDAVKKMGGDPDRINPICPADLVIDHSVQVDVSKRYIYRFLKCTHSTLSISAFSSCYFIIKSVLSFLWFAISTFI